MVTKVPTPVLNCDTNPKGALLILQNIFAMVSQNEFVETATSVASTPECSDSRGEDNTDFHSGCTVILQHKNYDQEEWESLAESILEQMETLFSNNTSGEYVRRILECLDWWILSMSDLDTDAKKVHGMSRHIHQVATFVAQMNDLYEWSERLANHKISQS